MTLKLFEKRKVPFLVYIILLIIFSPVLVEGIFLLLLKIDFLVDLVTWTKHWVKLFFPSKEIFWIAYTGIFTAISLLGAYFGAYFLPQLVEKKKEKKQEEDLLEAIIGEILMNWESLASQNLEVKINRNIYDLAISQFSVLERISSSQTIRSLNSLYQKLFVFEFLLDRYYARRYSVGRKEVGDDIEMRDLAFKTFEQRYQSLVEIMFFVKAIDRQEKESFLKGSSRPPEAVLYRLISEFSLKYSASITESTIRERLEEK